MDKAYRDYIKDLARKSRNVVFFNSSAEHASVVMSEIFLHSSKYIKIFAGNLRGDVSLDTAYQNSLNKFLREKGKLYILLEEYNKELPPNVASLLKFYEINDPDRVKIKTHSYQLYQNNDNGRKIHFCVADDKMYRIETDTEKYLAEGNFNDPTTALKLSKLFDDIFFDNKSHLVNILEV